MFSFETLKVMENRAELIGMKAESLIKLSLGGFNVPSGFVITTDDIERFSEIQLESFINENDEYSEYAVRSSGLNEDLTDASFAGMYDTFLNIKGIKNIKKAVNDCINSAVNERVKAYCKTNNIPSESCKMAVIIQKMVQAQKSGVAFSIDSVNGIDKQILIEAVQGLGEKLVSGQVTPDYYSYDWYDEKLTSYKGGVLSEAEVREVAEEVLKIQAMYGFPVDVEWAFLDKVLYILQARPITAVSYRAIESEWTTADFRDGGVSAEACKPLMASLYGFVFQPSFSNSLKSVRLMDKSNTENLYEVFFSRPYWSLTQEKKCFAKLPGFVERELDEDMGVSITYEGDGQVTKTNIKTLIAGINVLSASSRHIKKMGKNCENSKNELLSALKKAENINLSEKNAGELLNIFNSFISKDYFKSETTYFSYIFCNMLISSLFKDKVKKHLSPDEITDLMTGLDDISHMRPIYELWDMSREGENEKKLTEFIKKYKHHSLHELDISYPNWDETPDVVQGIIKDFLSMGDERAPKTLVASQKKKYTAALEKLPHKLRKEAETLRYFLWWREEFRDVSTKYYYEIRKISNALGKAWEKEGVLNVADDIYFLKVNDFLSVKTAGFKKIIEKNKLYYNSFKNYTNPNEIGNRFVSKMRKKNGNHVLKGVPCAGQTVTATARVVKNIHDAGKLNQGDILVTKCTDPAWTSVFGKLSGVITETGGLLSHAAVVSREYGIACILTVNDAVNVIKDGDKITMDCKTGEIFIHN